MRHKKKSGLVSAGADEARRINGNQHRRSTSPAQTRQGASASGLQDGAAISTIEALMFSLRECGEPALTRADNQRRLVELTPDQLAEVILRLDRMRTKYPAVTDSLLLRLGEKP